MLPTCMWAPHHVWVPDHALESDPEAVRGVLMWRLSKDTDLAVCSQAPSHVIEPLGVASVSYSSSLMEQTV